MRKINAQKIAKAALEAHAAGTLCFQHPRAHPTLAAAFYIHDEAPGIRCAVGAGLTEEQAKLAQNPGIYVNYAIDDLIMAGVFELEDYHNLRALRRMQILHDCLPSNVKEPLFLKFATALAADKVTPELFMECDPW